MIKTLPQVPMFPTSSQADASPVIRDMDFMYRPKISMMPLMQMTRVLLMYSHKLVTDIKVILKRKTTLNLQAVIMITR